MSTTKCIAVAGGLAMCLASEGSEQVELASGDGGRAVADTYGARIVSWRPAGGEEVFAMARSRDRWPIGEQVHGGVPIYWPWFVFEGPEGCRIHGVTGYAEWKVKERTPNRVVFALDDDDATRRAWPHRFHAELEYSLGTGLSATFRVTNTDTKSYACTEGFHPYFRVGDVRECTVSGTDGAHYFCRTEAEYGDTRVWSGDFPCRLPHEKGVGIVIEEPSAEGSHLHVLTDPVLKRRIEIAYEGNIKIAVWNSGPDFSPFGGADDPDYGLRFVCVEGATLYRDRAYTLKPGETHTLKLDIQVAGRGATGEKRADAPLALDGMRGFPKAQSAATFLPFVDKYGQFAHDDWPGKIHDDAELAASRKAEEAWLAGHPCPISDADMFGGWAGGPQLEATGHFRTEKVNGKWWLVDPAGRLFFSLGVNAVRLDSPTGTSGRESYFSWLPAKGDPVFGKFCGKWWTAAAHGFYREPANVPYRTFDFARANAFRKYGDDWKSGFPARSLARLRAWGLNTVSSWSDAAVQRSGKIPYTVKLSTKGPVIAGSKGWWGKLRDPFAAEFAENLRKTVAEEAALSGDDPWCIGWFVDNELSWGDDDLEVGRAVLASPSTQPAKIAAVSRLEEKYGSIAALNDAWSGSYASWEAVREATVTNAPSEDLAMAHGLVVAKYYGTVRDAVKAAAPDMLYLGSRIAKGKDAVYGECARYCDVVSVNVYGKTPYRDLPEGADDKPMLASEFHFGATDRGMFHPGLVAAGSQAERAERYRRYVEACLDSPRYVGAHWFQWQDQPLTGRPDGENFAIGLVSVADAPYPELVQAVQTTAAEMYRRRSSAANEQPKGVLRK